MPYRVDFHSHTGHSSDSLLPAARLLAAAARRRLAAIAVTDHNSLGGALQARALVERDPEQFGGLAVIAGEEVKTSEGEITGLFLREPIPRGLTPEETIRRIKDQGGLALYRLTSTKPVSVTASRVGAPLPLLSSIPAALLPLTVTNWSIAEPCAVRPVYPVPLPATVTKLIWTLTPANCTAAIRGLQDSLHATLVMVIVRPQPPAMAPE